MSSAAGEKELHKLFWGKPVSRYLPFKKKWKRNRGGGRRGRELKENFF